MTKNLIYIGANTLQEPGLKTAKAAGFRVVVTDANADAPNIPLADDYRQISGTDIKGMVALGEELQSDGGLAGIYCGSDFGLAAVAKVGEVCGVPAATPESVELALNKDKAVETLREAGVSVPEGRAVIMWEELLEAAEAFGYPLILKPIDSSGSRGVVTVSEESELNKAYMKALHFSMTVLAEKVVQGKHIDVNGLFVDGRFYPCGLLDRFFCDPPNNYPVWGHAPSSLTQEEANRVYAEVERGARALGINVGPVKGDVIYTHDGPVILEIAPRFHGDVSTSFVTPLACRQNAPAAWFAHLAGKPFGDLLPNDDKDVVAGWLGIFPDAPGTFEGLANLDEASALAGVDQIKQIKPQGYKVKSVSDNLAVLGFIWASGATPEEVKDRLDQARAKIRVRMVE